MRSGGKCVEFSRWCFELCASVVARAPHRPSLLYVRVYACVCVSALVCPFDCRLSTMNAFLPILLTVVAVSVMVALGTLVCLCCATKSGANGLDVSLLSTSMVTRTVAADASTTGCAAV